VRLRAALLTVSLTACIAAGLSGSAPGARRELRVRHFAFSPSELVVAVGDTLVWINDDPFVHSTRADSGAWSSPDMAHGNRFQLVARQPGRFSYHCAAHPVMRAVLIVRGAPK
jgi:plastocyanin